MSDDAPNHEPAISWSEWFDRYLLTILVVGLAVVITTLHILFEPPR